MVVIAFGVPVEYFALCSIQNILMPVHLVLVLCASLWVAFFKYKYSLNSLRMYCKKQPLIDCTYNPFLYQHALQETSLQTGVCACLFVCLFVSCHLK